MMTHSTAADALAWKSARRASKSSTDAQTSLCGFSYPDDRFQAIAWIIISDLWYGTSSS